jgi:hypothetical protein
MIGIVDDELGCTACFRGEPEDAWAKQRRLRVRRVLVDETHFGVSLSSCPDCGQELAHVFSERIDWAGGNDPQAWKVIPISPEEAARLATLDADAVEGALRTLAPPRRCLDVYHPSDGEKIFRWLEGPGIFMRHD